MSILSDSHILERHISSLGRPDAIWHGSRLMWVDDPSGLLVMWAARARVPDCRKGFFVDVELRTWTGRSKGGILCALPAQYKCASVTSARSSRHSFEIQSAEVRGWDDMPQ